jgi:hypothetical protein
VDLAKEKAKKLNTIVLRVQVQVFKRKKLKNKLVFQEELTME